MFRKLLSTAPRKGCREKVVGEDEPLHMMSWTEGQGQALSGRWVGEDLRLGLGPPVDPVDPQVLGPASST